MNDIDLAQSLFRKPAEIVTEAFGGRLPPYTVEAEAMEDSANGMVAVQFMGDTVNLTDGDPDGEGNTSDELSESGTAAQWVSVPCSATVKAGERVLVTIQDGSPIDCTSIGWGDTIATAVSTAVTLAEQAEAIASAIGQYAWNDSAGTHVSTEEAVSEGTRNILLNSYGILLRAAANYLAALTQSGIAFYDGAGNAASNIVASFGASGAQVGSDADTHLMVDADTVDVVDPVKGVLMSMGWDSTKGMAVIESGKGIQMLNVDGNSSTYYQANTANEITGISTASSGSGYSDSSGFANAGASYDSSSSSSSFTIEADKSTSGMPKTAIIYGTATASASSISLSADKVRVSSVAPITTQTFSATISSTVSGNNATGNFSIAKTGYTPIAAQWWWSTGTRQNFLNDFGCHFEGNTYYYRFTNLHSSQAASGTLQVRVVYVRTEMV